MDVRFSHTLSTKANQACNPLNVRVLECLNGMMKIDLPSVVDNGVDRPQQSVVFWSGEAEISQCKIGM